MHDDNVSMYICMVKSERTTGNAVVVSIKYGLC